MAPLPGAGAAFCAPLHQGVPMNEQMLRPPEVMKRTGLSRTTLWRRVRAGTFPASTELGENSIGWPASTISAWLAARPQRTYGAKTPYQPAEEAVT